MDGEREWPTLLGCIALLNPEIDIIKVTVKIK